MIQALSRSWCIKGSDEFMTRVDSSFPLMHNVPDRSRITDRDPDQPKRGHRTFTTGIDVNHLASFQLLMK